MRTVHTLAVTALVALGVVALATLLLPRAMGLQALAVHAPTMSPTFDTGALVLVDSAAPDTLRTGDIVTFRTAGGLATHRIVATDRAAGQRFFTTRGDANAAADPVPIAERDVVGRVRVSVPLLGGLVARLVSPSGALLVLALVLLVVATGGRRVAPAPRVTAVRTGPRKVAFPSY